MDETDSSRRFIFSERRKNMTTGTAELLNGEIQIEEISSYINPAGVVTVTASATLVSAYNSTRKWILITNNGANDCYIGLSNQLVVGSGALLKAGGAFSLSNMGETQWQGYIYAISAAGTTLGVVEC